MAKPKFQTSKDAETGEVKFQSVIINPGGNKDEDGPVRENEAVRQVLHAYAFHYLGLVDVEEVGLHIPDRGKLSAKRCEKIGYIHSSYNGDTIKNILRPVPGWYVLKKESKSMPITAKRVYTHLERGDDAGQEIKSGVAAVRKHDFIDQILEGDEITVDVRFMQKFASMFYETVNADISTKTKLQAVRDDYMFAYNNAKGKRKSQGRRKTIRETKTVEEIANHNIIVNGATMKIGDVVTGQYFTYNKNTRGNPVVHNQGDQYSNERLFDVAVSGWELRVR